MENRDDAKVVSMLFRQHVVYFNSLNAALMFYASHMERNRDVI